MPDIHTRNDDSSRFTVTPSCKELREKIDDREDTTITRKDRLRREITLLRQIAERVVNKDKKLRQKTRLVVNEDKNHNKIKISNLKNIFTTSDKNPKYDLDSAYDSNTRVDISSSMKSDASNSLPQYITVTNEGHELEQRNNLITQQIVKKKVYNKAKKYKSKINSSKSSIGTSSKSMSLKYKKKRTNTKHNKKLSEMNKKGAVFSFNLKENLVKVDKSKIHLPQEEMKIDESVQLKKSLSEEVKRCDELRRRNEVMRSIILQKESMYEKEIENIHRKHEKETNSQQLRIETLTSKLHAQDKELRARKSEAKITRSEIELLEKTYRVLKATHDENERNFRYQMEHIYEQIVRPLKSKILDQDIEIKKLFRKLATRPSKEEEIIFSKVKIDHENISLSSVPNEKESKYSLQSDHESIGGDLIFRMQCNSNFLSEEALHNCLDEQIKLDISSSTSKCDKCDASVSSKSSAVDLEKYNSIVSFDSFLSVLEDHQKIHEMSDVQDYPVNFKEDSCNKSTEAKGQHIESRKMENLQIILCHSNAKDTESQHLSFDTSNDGTKDTSKGTLKTSDQQKLEEINNTSNLNKLCESDVQVSVIKNEESQSSRSYLNHSRVKDYSDNAREMPEMLVASNEEKNNSDPVGNKSESGMFDIKDETTQSSLSTSIDSSVKRCFIEAMETEKDLDFSQAEKENIVFIDNIDETDSFISKITVDYSQSTLSYSDAPSDEQHSDEIHGMSESIILRKNEEKNKKLDMMDGEIRLSLPSETKSNIDECLKYNNSEKQEDHDELKSTTKGGKLILINKDQVHDIEQREESEKLPSKQLSPDKKRNTMSKRDDHISSYSDAQPHTSISSLLCNNDIHNRYTSGETQVPSKQKYEEVIGSSPSKSMIERAISSNNWKVIDLEKIVNNALNMHFNTSSRQIQYINERTFRVQRIHIYTNPEFDYWYASLSLTNQKWDPSLSEQHFELPGDLVGKRRGKLVYRTPESASDALLFFILHDLQPGGEWMKEIFNGDENVCLLQKETARSETRWMALIREDDLVYLVNVRDTSKSKKAVLLCDKQLLKKDNI